MNVTDARDLLLAHGYSHDDLSHPKMESGFLGTLRPYRGLREENFHEVMSCLMILSSELRNAECLDRQLVSSLWGMCHLARAWGVEGEGLLRSNNLIADEDVRRLDEWIEIVSYAAMCLFDGQDDAEAFEPYKIYCQEKAALGGKPHNIDRVDEVS